MQKPSGRHVCRCFSAGATLAVGLVVWMITGCATTTFLSTWKDSSAVPLGKAKGQTVVACVATEDASLRREAEDALAAQLTKRGLKGVASYKILPPGRQDEAQAKATFDKIGAVAAVVVRPLSIDKEVTVMPPVYNGPQYSGFYAGYWNHAWRYPYLPPTVQTDTIITVEILFYSLAQNKLVWAGRSKTTNPSRVQALVQELVEASADEMNKAGVF